MVDVLIISFYCYLFQSLIITNKFVSEEKTVAKEDKAKSKDAQNTKKKQAPFLHREVKVFDF